MDIIAIILLGQEPEQLISLGTVREHALSILA